VQQVILVTGGGSGIGLAFAKLVYAKNAVVWISARTEAKAKAAIEETKTSAPGSVGELHFIQLDLVDLPTIKPGVEKFISSSSRLNLLMNNAGIISPADKSKTEQGFELQLGTNVIGHHAFTVLLTPLILKTAKESPPGSVRVVWTSSIGGVKLSPPGGGISWDDINYQRTSSGSRNFGAYGQSKAGNIYQAAEFARRYGNAGVLTASVHPGLVSSNFSRNNRFDPFFLL
jgi:NAD(P)-dependent dehydrogenase (short-subunit alcohol dehydrogenase family)